MTRTALYRFASLQGNSGEAIVENSGKILFVVWVETGLIRYWSSNFNKVPFPLKYLA